MTIASAHAEERAAVWGCRLAALGLLALSAWAHLALLSSSSPIDLAPDEAHYWDWSRHLDWSYYSKGPLVAWIIAAGTGIAGPTVFGVRWPALVCQIATLVALYLLTARSTGRERLAVAVVALALTLPVVHAGGTLMTIDPPFCALWAWALVFGLEAVIHGRHWAWPAAGLCVALGLLAKPTMILWPASLGLFLLVERRRLGTGFVVLLAVAGLGLVPMVVWNQYHGWVTFRHVANHAAGEAPGILWSGPLAFLGGQALLLLGFWFVVGVAALTAARPRPGVPLAHRYLWWMAVPTVGLFAVWSLKVSVQLNWPVPGYLAGVVLVALWLEQQVRRSWAWRAALGLALAGGLAISVVMYDTRPISVWLAGVAGEPTEAMPMPLRRVDPTTRLRGWRTLARAVDTLRCELRAAGEEPVLAGTYWTLPGELAFYVDGRPTVYCIGPALGERHSQYDLWRPNPLRDPAHFQGRTFLIVSTGVPPDLGSAFERVEPPRLVLHEEAGRPIALWAVLVAHGFRGFPEQVGTPGY